MSVPLGVLTDLVAHAKRYADALGWGRDITFGTSRWFSICCCTTKKISTKITFSTDTVAATPSAGTAAMIGPTTGIISPIAEMSAST